MPPSPPPSPCRSARDGRTSRRPSRSNLKRIGLAFHDAHNADDRLPGDIRDGDGKPLLSWRVAILPYLGEEALYKQFSVDEAWDGATNKKLVAKRPKVYAPVQVEAKAGETFYQAFAGGGTLFPEEGMPRRFIDVTDGLSNTALVEAGAPVIWTKPGGLPFDPREPLPKLGGLFGGGAARAAGRRPRHPGEEGLRRGRDEEAGLPAGDEVVDFDKLTR